MHQNQWLAVLEELEQPLPVPSDFKHEKIEYAYNYFVQSNVPLPEHARFMSGPSMDGRGQFSVVTNTPMGQIPTLSQGPMDAHSIVIPKEPNVPLVSMMPSPAEAANSPMNGASMINVAPSTQVGTPSLGGSSADGSSTPGGIAGAVETIVSKVTGSDSSQK